MGSLVKVIFFALLSWKEKCQAANSLNLNECLIFHPVWECLMIKHIYTYMQLYFLSQFFELFYKGNKVVKVILTVIYDLVPVSFFYCFFSPQWISNSSLFIFTESTCFRGSKKKKLWIFSSCTFLTHTKIKRAFRRTHVECRKKCNSKYIFKEKNSSNFFTLLAVI